MKPWYCIALFAIVFSLVSCDEGDEYEPVPVPPVAVYPYLKIVNENTDLNPKSITAVVLVGYDFRSLSIAKGNSQTFILDKGMPGGYSNINVDIGFGPQGGWRNKKVNFTDGATTTITLKGCISAEGCTGFYLE